MMARAVFVTVVLKITVVLKVTGAGTVTAVTVDVVFIDFTGAIPDWV